MKTIATLILIAGHTIPLLAGPATIKLDVRYDRVDAKWFSDLAPTTMTAFRNKGESVGLPLVTAKTGEKATIEVIQEYRTGKSTQKDAVVPCGVIVELTPEMNKAGIRIVGKAVLRHSKNRDAGGVATRFEAQEVLIDLSIADGASKAVDLEDGGQMIISATLIDATGRPING